MDFSRKELEDRAMGYCQTRGHSLAMPLGFGIDGLVYSTSKFTAVKAHERHFTYYMERDVYQRLAEWNIKKVCGHNVPRLIDHDDELWVIEMTIVKPPFVLDFAKATIDFPPDFSEDVMQEWHARNAELFDER